MSYQFDILEVWSRLSDVREHDADTMFAGSVSAWQNKSNAQVTTIRTIATCVDSQERIEETLERLKAYKAALRR